MCPSRICWFSLASLLLGTSIAHSRQKIGDNDHADDDDDGEICKVIHYNGKQSGNEVIVRTHETVRRNEFMWRELSIVLNKWNGKLTVIA